MRLHAYVLPISSYALSSVGYSISIGANFGNRKSGRDGPSWKGARRDQVACATEMCILNAQIEDSLKICMEAHHDAFANVEPDCWVIQCDPEWVFL